MNKLLIGMMAAGLVVGTPWTARAADDDEAAPAAAPVAAAQDADDGEDEAPAPKKRKAAAAEPDEEDLTAKDAGSDVVTAAQEEKQMAGAPKSKSVDVAQRVRERTAATMKMKPNRVGSYDHKKDRIAIVGEASCMFDLDDKKQANNGKWALQRVICAKRAVLNAKLKLSTALGVQLSAEEKSEIFDTAPEAERKAQAKLEKEGKEPAAARTGMKTTSVMNFMSDHPILGATVLFQEESYIDGEYKIAVSLIWSKALQKAAVATLTAKGDFREAKLGKMSLEDWIDKQENPALMIGPRQYVDNEGIRHFMGISAIAVGKNPVIKQKNMRLAQLDAMATAAFSMLSDVETVEQAGFMAEEYAENPDDLDSKSVSDVTATLASRVSQKIEEQMIQGLDQVFEETIEHPLFPGNDLYVYCCELNAAAAAKLRAMAREIYKARGDVARDNEKQKVIKRKLRGTVNEAKAKGRAEGEATTIRYNGDDDAAANGGRGKRSTRGMTGVDTSGAQKKKGGRARGFTPVNGIASPDGDNDDNF